MWACYFRTHSKLFGSPHKNTTILWPIMNLLEFCLSRLPDEKEISESSPIAITSVSWWVDQALVEDTLWMVVGGATLKKLIK